MNSKRGHLWLQAPILPVVVVNDVPQALAIAEGLLQGGLPHIEITLRTPPALHCIEAIAKAHPSMAVSAGTVLTPDLFDQAHAAGATLFISPGLTERLAEHAALNHYNWMPGVATASEAMRAMEWGYTCCKFFPAMAAGGPKALAGIVAPLAGLYAVPTGGIALDNLKDWKALPQVQACGGTWLTANLPEGPGELHKVVELVAERARQALAVWQDAG